MYSVLRVDSVYLLLYVRPQAIQTLICRLSVVLCKASSHSNLDLQTVSCFTQSTFTLGFLNFQQ